MTIATVMDPDVPYWDGRLVEVYGNTLTIPLCPTAPLTLIPKAEAIRVINKTYVLSRHFGKLVWVPR